MRITEGLTIGTGFGAWICAAALVLTGCGGAAEEAEAPAPAITNARIDPETYAGDVTFRLEDTLPVRGRDVPLTLYLGLAPRTETRMGMNAFLDLRALQKDLPELLSVPLDPSCSLALDVTFRDAAAEGQAIRGRGTVRAALHRCRDAGTQSESRGIRLLASTIDFDALVSAGIEDNCMKFHLDDLALAPRGLLGGLSDLLGLTERVRAAIIASAGTTLGQNPVCPNFPEGLALLEPEFIAGGAREIGDGGIGAAIQGSILTRADTLIGLLALAEARGILPGSDRAPIEAPPGRADPAGPRVDLRLDNTLDARGQDIPYALDLGLTAAAPTRIGIAATIDLRAAQRRLPDLAAGTGLFDVCGTRVTLRTLSAEAEGNDLTAIGGLDIESFACDQTSPGTWQRGALERSQSVAVRASFTARIAADCVVFDLRDLSRETPLPITEVETATGNAQAARAMMIEAIGLLLEDHPVCPDLPPALTLLDPRFDSGHPFEIAPGGIGVTADGSIDLAAPTMIALLRHLQTQGALPPPPG